jgi:glycosyltransferase involved in cell wall biosynthesis
MGAAMTSPQSLPESCGSCGIHACEFNAEATLCRVPLTGEAWLLDEVWPEFDAYLSRRDAADAHVFTPWKSARPPLPAYRWSCAAKKTVMAAPDITLRRSLAMRGSRLSGGRRQKILEHFDRRYAAAFARGIPYNISRLVVWQNFLPFLFQDKTLGGREYDVLLWRAPRQVLEETLDRAAGHYPDSSTLRDFRSAPDLVEAERCALDRARRIITPHRELAKLYPGKTTLLDWARPSPADKNPMGGRIAFLGPTVARRGAYLVRTAMQKLGHPLLVLGRNVERPDFWDGVEIEERALGPDCLRDVALLISPSITDFKPRLLLRALSSGIPVVATPACGLPEMENLHFVDPFDADGLAGTIEDLISNRAKT